MNSIKNHSTAFSLSEPELLELLRSMDVAAGNRVPRDRRKHLRNPHISKETRVKVVQPGGGTTERQVTVREISAGGLSMLYPGYLHSGSLVEIELKKRAGGGSEVTSGQVKNCRHIRGVWHAVGIQFKEVIFPQLFLSQAARGVFEEPKAVKVDLSSLKGSVLLIDDQPMDRMLFTHLLKGSSLRVTEAGNCEEALALVVRSLVPAEQRSASSAEPFALVVCDLNLGNTGGEMLIAQIREKGYRGPLMILTAESTQGRINAALSAGGTCAIRKPYTAEKLHATIAGQLGNPCTAVDDPLHSPLSADPQNRLMLEKYVAQVRMMAVELRKWINEENLEQVRTICQTLKGTGAGYGFATLTDVANAALLALDASASVAESITDLHRLDAVCSRLTSAEAPRSGPRR